MPTTYTIETGGYTRTYHGRNEAGAADALILLHGAAPMWPDPGLVFLENKIKHDPPGWAIFCPDALPGTDGGQRWIWGPSAAASPKAPVGSDEDTDVDFLRALVAHLQGEGYGKIRIGGMSMGGLLVYHCMVKGIAGVDGYMPSHIGLQLDFDPLPDLSSAPPCKPWFHADDPNAGGTGFALSFADTEAALVAAYAVTPAGSSKSNCCGGGAKRLHRRTYSPAGRLQGLSRAVGGHAWFSVAGCSCAQETEMTEG